MDIVAMDDRIGLPEPRVEAGIVERDAGDALARQCATHLDCRRAMHVGEHLILEAELLQRAEYVGAELDAGADLAELGRLLQHPHRHALQCERICCREPADAAACDQDGQRLTIALCHGSLPDSFVSAWCDNISLFCN
jgi:hypothetical protein